MKRILLILATTLGMCGAVLAGPSKIEQPKMFYSYEVCYGRYPKVDGYLPDLEARRVPGGVQLLERYADRGYSIFLQGYDLQFDTEHVKQTLFGFGDNHLVLIILPDETVWHGGDL